MSMDDLDRILMSERVVAPSAPFADRVMYAVRREAAVPPEIVFPWRHLAPMLVVCGVALVTAFALFAILLARSNAPLDALKQSPVVHAAGVLWSSGLPLLAGTLFVAWFLFGLSGRLTSSSR